MKETIEIEEPKQQKHLPDHYIDIMLEKYKPAKTKAGEEYIGNPLEYFTIQQNFMSTDEEWDFVAKYGFEMLGFLCVLRLYMTIGLGYGIKLGRDLRKTIRDISADSNIPIAKIEEWYNILLENKFLVIIDSVNGTQVVTTYNQIYNWELREHTKLVNNIKSNNSRKNKKNKENQASCEDAPPYMEDIPSDDEMQAMAAMESEVYHQEGGM